MTDEQIQAVAQGQMGESDLQSLVSQAQLSESVLQSAVSQNQYIDNVQNDETVLQTINTNAANARTEIAGISSQVYDVLKSGSDDNNVHPVLMFKNGVGVTLTEDEEGDSTMDEDEIREETMDSIEDKNDVNNDQMLALVDLPDV